MSNVRAGGLSQETDSADNRGMPSNTPSLRNRSPLQRAQALTLGATLAAALVSQVAAVAAADSPKGANSDHCPPGHAKNATCSAPGAPASSGSHSAASGSPETSTSTTQTAPSKSGPSKPAPSKSTPASKTQTTTNAKRETTTETTTTTTTTTASTQAGSQSHPSSASEPHQAGVASGKNPPVALAIAIPSPANLSSLIPVSLVPAFGHQTLVGSLAGAAQVQLPGQTTFVPLASDTKLVMGSLIDARVATVRLVSATGLDGALQGANLAGGEFRLRQGPGGRTDIILAGRAPSRVCAPAPQVTPGQAVIASARAAHHGRPLRSLWAADSNGRFSTHGSNSVTTTLGTEWRTVEYCTGTLTRVFKGRVSVLNLTTHQRIMVKAGHEYFSSTQA